MRTSNLRRPIRRLIAGVAVIAALSTTAACSLGEDEPAADPTSSTSASAEETGGDEEPESTQVFPDMGDDFAGVLADVTQDACPVEKGAVEAKGTVVNSAKKPRDLFIGVIWLKKNSGDSVDGGLGEWTAKAVPPGETVEWSVKADLDSKPARCVLQAKSNKVGTLK